MNLRVQDSSMQGVTQWPVLDTTTAGVYNLSWIMNASQYKSLSQNAILFTRSLSKILAGFISEVVYQIKT